MTTQQPASTEWENKIALRNRIQRIVTLEDGNGICVLPPYMIDKLLVFTLSLLSYHQQVTAPQPAGMEWAKKIRDKWQALDDGKTVTRSGIRPSLLDQFIDDVGQEIDRQVREAREDLIQRLQIAAKEASLKGRDEILGVWRELGLIISENSNQETK